MAFLNDEADEEELTWCLTMLLISGANPYIQAKSGKISFALSKSPEKFIKLNEDICFAKRCAKNVFKQIRRIGESRSLSPDGLYFKLSCLYSKAKDLDFIFQPNNVDSKTLVNYVGANDKETLIWKLESLLKSSPCCPSLLLKS